LETELALAENYNDEEMLTYYSLMYPDGSINQVEISSKIFELTFKSAVAKCESSLDYKSCQILANLCVLQFYDLDSTACEAYRNIAKVRDHATAAFKDKYALKCLTV
jgi:hypothetical protein